MLTYLRYALATVCFSTSIGSLTLWWRNCLDPDAMALIEICITSTHILMLKAELGFAVVSIAPRYTDMPVVGGGFGALKVFQELRVGPKSGWA